MARQGRTLLEPTQAGPRRVTQAQAIPALGTLGQVSLAQVLPVLGIHHPATLFQDIPDLVLPSQVGQILGLLDQNGLIHGTRHLSTPILGIPSRLIPTHGTQHPSIPILDTPSRSRQIRDTRRLGTAIRSTLIRSTAILGIPIPTILHRVTLRRIIPIPRKRLQANHSIGITTHRQHLRKPIRLMAGRVDLFNTNLRASANHSLKLFYLFLLQCAYGSSK
jgi:hypothetical protein